MARRVAVIRGDGIGPEVVDAALKVLEAMDVDLEFIHCAAGYTLWKERGLQITSETLETLKNSDAILKGPTITPVGPASYRSVAVTIRQALNLYANVRPVKFREGVPAIHRQVDLVIVRENTEGLYAGEEAYMGNAAISTRIITRKASERIAKFAFELAKKQGRRKVTAVHKANILKATDGLFLEACREVAKNYPEIAFEDLLVDAAAMRLVMRPQELDVIVTTNMFGDILSDEAAGLVGGVGVAPSANIGERNAMFEPVHGAAPDIAGLGIANPTAMLLSASMMLDYLNMKEKAKKLEKAVENVLRDRKKTTPDIGGKAKTMEMVEAIIDELEAL